MSLNELVAQAEEITLYLETENEGVDYEVDNVVMEKVVISDAWRKQAEEDIERLRKSNITINFSGIDATDLTLNVTQVSGVERNMRNMTHLDIFIICPIFQLSHSFPFGHAVKSPMISQCHESGTDDEFCQHIANNYNLVVDTFRY